MGYEPNARERLRRLMESTSDLTLRLELTQHLELSSMPFVPSVALRNAIAGCDACRSDGVAPIDRSALCTRHRSRYNLEVCADRAALQQGPEHLDDLLRRAMASDDLGAELLTAFRRQAIALDAVWEAYRRGAANLPDSVAASVEQAIVKVPRILGGAPMRATSLT